MNYVYVSLYKLLENRRMIELELNNNLQKKDHDSTSIEEEMRLVLSKTKKKFIKRRKI